MTAFKFQIFNSGGQPENEFEDDAIAAFWLAESLSGMSADLLDRSFNQGALNKSTWSSGAVGHTSDDPVDEGALWSPFTSVSSHHKSRCSSNNSLTPTQAARHL